MVKALIVYILCMLFSWPAQLMADDDYSFDLDEFEKKKLEWGGYVELKWDHINLNQEGAFYWLNFHDNPRSTLDRLSGTLQFNGNYNFNITTFNWLVQATGQQAQTGWYDAADIFEAYASVKPTPMVTAGLGKKTFKWGKGYAWNPVGFIDRSKDPDNPEEALEGYIGAELDLVKSYLGDVQTMALTTVVLPVYQGVNEDFGEKDNMNMAAKLYLLYLDTDIDLVFFTGNSRSTRFGIDFSKNIATNFEIHGELAHTPERVQRVLTEDGSLSSRSVSDTSYLLGIRYLTGNDLTTIVEFYHNGDGYSKEEMNRFYQLVDNARTRYLFDENRSLLENAAAVSSKGYGRPHLGRNYLYTRFIQKDPFDILYTAPALTAIINLNDRSFSVTPEIIYTGFTNWELRLRLSVLNGADFSEYGEKVNESKLEVRTRYFF